MSFGSQINVAQDFAAPGAPAADPAAPIPSTSQLAPNGCAPVAPPAAPLHRTVSAPTVGVAVPGQPQTLSAPGAAAGPTSSGALMGPPPPQPQHITVERGCQKKTRLVWTEELHMRFLFAVEKIGLRTAVPRTILQVMQVDGLTRENIASHLQKYRRLLEKKAGISGPVGTKDWPKLEAAQTHHLAQLRKQMDSATAAADAATTAAAAAAVAATSAAPAAAAAAVSSGTAADPSSQHAAAPQTTAAPAAAATPAAASAAAAPPQQTVALPVLGPAAQPPQQQPMAPPVSAPQVLPPGSAAPTWQEQAPPPSCIPPPATPHQLPQPGICPVTPQEPAQVPVPTSDSDGNTLGVPMPQPIMPPLMCVLPQSDGSPALLPMLPAMYMASYGRNTPDFLGTVPLSRQQVPGMGAMPHAPQHPRPYAHAHAHAHPHPAHHMVHAASGMYPGSYGYPAAPPQQYQAMPVAQPAGIGSPMFPSAYPPQMHMAPMPAPMAHDPNMHVPHSSEMMGGMHGAGYAWPRPNGWRTPQSKAGGHQARSTLPPLVSERQRSQHVPLSSGPHSQSAPHMQTRATSGARNNGARAPGSGVVHHHADTGEVNGSFGGGMYHEGVENNGNNTAGRPPRANNRALNRRSHSNGAVGASMPIDAVDEDTAMGHAADVDWGDDAIEDVKLDPLALTSSTLRIANMKLDPGVVADGAVHGHEVEATLGEIPDAHVEDVPGMDLDELGWPAWPEPGTSSGNGEVEL